MNQVRRTCSELWCNVPVSEERVVPDVSTGLVRQQVSNLSRGRDCLVILDGLGRRAEGVRLGTVDRNTYVIGYLRILVRVRVLLQLPSFGRMGSENLRDVDCSVLEARYSRSRPPLRRIQPL